MATHASPSLFETWTTVSSVTKKEVSSFNEEDLVYLKKGVYEPQLANPGIGSEYECTGQILLKQNSGRIKVLWANGSVNSYEPTSLILKKRYLAKTNKYKSIW